MTGREAILHGIENERFLLIYLHKHGVEVATDRARYIADGVFELFFGHTADRSHPIVEFLAFWRRQRLQAGIPKPRNLDISQQHAPAKIQKLRRVT